MSLLVNLFTSTMGYFPANLMGLGEPMAPGVGKDWGQWIRLPGYITAPKAVGAFTLSLSVSCGR